MVKIAIVESVRGDVWPYGLFSIELPFVISFSLNVITVSVDKFLKSEKLKDNKVHLKRDVQERNNMSVYMFVCVSICTVNVRKLLFCFMLTLPRGDARRCLSKKCKHVPHKNNSKNVPRICRAEKFAKKYKIMMMIRKAMVATVLKNHPYLQKGETRRNS